MIIIATTFNAGCDKLTSYKGSSERGISLLNPFYSWGQGLTIMAFTSLHSWLQTPLPYSPPTFCLIYTLYSSHPGFLAISQFKILTLMPWLMIFPAFSRLFPFPNQSSLTGAWLPVPYRTSHTVGHLTYFQCGK